MKLLIIENPNRLSYIDKALSKVIPAPDKRLSVVNMLLEIDPTNQKMMAQWLAKLVVRGFLSISGIVSVKPNNQIKLPEDAARIRDSLATFDKSKPRIATEYRDINKYEDFYDLEERLSEIVSSGKSQAVGSSIVRKVPGAEIIYRDDTYTLYKIDRIRRVKDGTYTQEEQVRMRAVEDLGMGPPETKWCTRKDYPNCQSAYYLGKDDIYILYKNGKPFMQKCGREVKNVFDHNDHMPEFIDEYLDKYLDELNQEKTAAAASRFKELVGNKEIPTGKSAVMTKGGTIILCDKIVNAGRLLYIGINKLGNQRKQYYTIRPAKRNNRSVLEQSGLASFQSVSRFDWLKQDFDADRLGRDYRRDRYNQQAKRLGKPPLGPGEYPNYIERYRNDAAGALITKWNYGPILTVNMENVAGIHTA